jgi:Y-X(10)_GDL-associated radical SAM protein
LRSEQSYAGSTPPFLIWKLDEDTPMTQPTRLANEDDYLVARPVHVVWELTLACDLRCIHCGSRAGKARRQELTTKECQQVVEELAELGTREVTLIGGEAYLRKDWLEIVRSIRQAGIGCSLQSGGRRLTDDRLQAAKEAGLQSVGISIDGLPDLHDDLRGVKGSFKAAIGVLRRAKDYGLQTTANTQLTSLVIPQLHELFDVLVDLGVQNWQVQLTVAMGRAADNPEILLQPYRLLEVMPLLAELFRKGVARGLLLQPGNNIGYFGPYEELWRGFGLPSIHWTGCSAAITSMGIEADGTVKGCPSLPTRAYAGGNVRDGRLRDMWRTSHVLNDVPGRGRAALWGFCRDCYYADICRGGCTWTSHSLFGQPGNNPYCHHRALELDRQGLRERIVQSAPAPGTPFDHGRFNLVVEPSDGLGPQQLQRAHSTGCGPTLLQISRTRPTDSDGVKPSLPPSHLQLPTQLDVCQNCHRHVFVTETVCPHCEQDLSLSKQIWEEKLKVAERELGDLVRRIRDW